MTPPTDRVPGLFTLVLHTHLPWLAHHGRWPVGEEWLYQSWAAAYLPLLRVLRSLADMDARHGGSIIDAQIARAVADAPWPDQLLADVAAVTAADFEVVEAGGRDIDDSLDLVAIAVRP